MTDTADLQISAFLDDELSRDECEFLVRRLSRDPEARRQLLRYGTIGAALRGELLGPDPDILRRRISAALEGVHIPARAEPPVQSGYHRFTRPAIGAAIAASVALVALLIVGGLPAGGERAEPRVAASAQSPAEPALRVALPPSYVMPVSESSPSSITMTDYIVRHSQYTPAMRGPSISSVVVGEQHYWRVVPASQSVE